MCSSTPRRCFSALQRAEIAEMVGLVFYPARPEPVSVLFNEPKLLKFRRRCDIRIRRVRFSALQRAEIAEIERYFHDLQHAYGFSALQRAEIAEMVRR